MRDSMWALTYDRSTDPWETSKGLRRTEVPRPVLNETKNPSDSGMVLIKMRYAGFCGSDRGIWFRRAFRDMIHQSLDREGKDRRVTGHELLGEVVAVGSMAAREFGYQPGDIMATESHIVCGNCYQCRIGDNHVCAEDLIIGISTDGCFAEYVKLPARVLWPVDLRRIRPEIAAIQEPFGNAVHTCTKVNVRGKRVAIIGCGTIGLFSVAIAKALGAKSVIGIEPSPTNTAMAKQLGADHMLAPKNLDPKSYAHDPDLAKAVRDLTEGVGADVVLEMSGAPSSVNNAIACTRRGGDVILFGVKSGDQVVESFDRIIMNGISLHGVVGRRIFETWHITRRLLEDPETKIQEKVWDVILKRGQGTVMPFAEFEPASFEERINKHPKVVIKFPE
jgi:threonine 3-dehydrogenase